MTSDWSGAFYNGPSDDSTVAMFTSLTSARSGTFHSPRSLASTANSGSRSRRSRTFTAFHGPIYHLSNNLFSVSHSSNLGFHGPASHAYSNKTSFSATHDPPSLSPCLLFNNRTVECHPPLLIVHVSYPVDPRRSPSRSS